MRILVTAGNTQAPIDRVRCLTNIFTGRTGTNIAYSALGRGHQVTLAVSTPDFQAAIRQTPLPAGHITTSAFRTFDDLQRFMSELVPRGELDAIIHSAAVSDYLSAGVYSPAPNTRFRPDGRWESNNDNPPTLVDRAAGKVKSDEPELWIRLVRAPKLIDRIRSDWGFCGVLVKFKLEVGVGDEQLLAIAEHSRCHSRADLMVANSLEGYSAYAFLGPVNGRYERVGRGSLPQRLLEEIERIHKERRRV